MTTGYTKNFALALPDFRAGPWHDLVNGNTTKIDQIIFGALTGVDTPPWDHNTLYEVGEQVIDSDSASTWMCNVEHTSPSTGTFEDYRTANPTHWVQLLSGFAPRGEWQNATEYRPYDLAYESSSGIFAQCKTKHISNVSGTIVDDEVYWYWIVNFGEADLSTALAVSYDPTASGLAVTNVQAAIDKVETQIVSLNSVNVSQGSSITALQNKDTVHESRMTTIESKDTSQDSTLAGLQTQCTSLQNQINAIGAFPSGTQLVFCQSSPPAGWTIVSGLGNKGLRVVSDASGGSQGGTLNFDVVFNRTATDGKAISIAEMPPHAHGYSDSNMSPTGGFDAAGTFTDPVHYVPGSASGTTGSQGSGQAHTHGIDLRLAYVNVFVGRKT